MRSQASESELNDLELQVAGMAAEKERMATELDKARKDGREANQQLLAAESSIGLAKARVEAAEKGFATVDAERQYLEKEMQKLAKARAELDARRGVAQAKIGALALMPCLRGTSSPRFLMVGPWCASLCMVGVTVQTVLTRGSSSSNSARRSSRRTWWQRSARRRRCTPVQRS